MSYMPFHLRPGEYRIVAQVSGRREAVEDDERWHAMPDEEADAYKRGPVEHGSSPSSTRRGRLV